MAKLVNWQSFEAKLKEKQLLLFSAVDVRRVLPVSKVAATFLLHRYAQRGFIVRVKRGLYAFPNDVPPELYIANKLYEPSYVSLEFALSYHRVIPETVYEITSVSPKANRRFEALNKAYSYRRITKKAFTGYIVQKQKGFNFIIADAEKAFVDTLYYRLLSNRKPISRFDKSKINVAKAVKYANLFGNPKLVAVAIRTLRTTRK